MPWIFPHKTQRKACITACRNLVYEPSLSHLDRAEAEMLYDCGTLIFVSSSETTFHLPFELIRHVPSACWCTVSGTVLSCQSKCILHTFIIPVNTSCIWWEVNYSTFELLQYWSRTGIIKSWLLDRTTFLEIDFGHWTTITTDWWCFWPNSHNF